MASLTENEKALLHLYLNEQGFKVAQMPPEALERCYQYCDERLSRGAAYGDAFEALRESLINAIHSKS